MMAESHLHAEVMACRTENRWQYLRDDSGIFVLWERRTDRDELMAAGGRSTKYRLKHTKQDENSAANVTAYTQSLVSRLYDYNV